MHESNLGEIKEWTRVSQSFCERNLRIEASILIMNIEQDDDIVLMSMSVLNVI